MSISDSIRSLARSQGAIPALVRADDSVLSYRDLDMAIDTAAQRLLAEGLRSGQTVSLPVVGPDEALAFIVALALARLGIASADPSVPPRRLDGAMYQRGGRAPHGVRAILIDLGWLRGTCLPVQAREDDQAVLRIFATSGTTGVSKHCALTHADMAARIAANSYPEVLPNERTVMICALGLGGAAAQRRALLILRSGGTLVFTNPDRFANSVLRHKVNVVVTSVATLQMLVRKLPPGLGSLPPLRAVVASGSQLPAALARDAAARLCRTVFTSFGSTEVAPIAFGRFGEFPDIPLAIGRVVAGTQAEAVDDWGAVLPPGEEGLLRFRAPGMATQYLDDPQTSSVVFRDGWFHSGDRGAVTADGILISTGRSGDFINTGGVKVDPRVIEDVLLAQPGVSQAAAFGVPDQHGLAQIWAAVVVSPGTDTGAIARAAGAALGARAPRAVIQVPNLPRNANGKVMVQELVAYAAQQYRSA